MERTKEECRIQRLERFRQVAALLPTGTRRVLERLDEKEKESMEEIRLRCNQPPSMVGGWGEKEIPGGLALIKPGDLNLVLEIATQASAHAALEQVRNGFFTIQGGHRIGICGNVVIKDGAVWNMRQVSSLAIRIAQEERGISTQVLDQLYENGRLQSTLILSPPGMGKTTLLRDLIRAISDGDGVPAQRVGVADERGELAAMHQCVPQLQVGAHTDVLDGCPKGAGLLMLLRGMNPQVLAADEITAPEDIQALEMAANCGVTLLATAHAADFADLESRPLYQKLLSTGVFRQAVLIERAGKERRYHVVPL